MHLTANRVTQEMPAARAQTGKGIKCNSRKIESARLIQKQPFSTAGKVVGHIKKLESGGGGIAGSAQRTSGGKEARSQGCMISERDNFVDRYRPHPVCNAGYLFPDTD